MLSRFVLFVFVLSFLGGCRPAADVDVIEPTPELSHRRLALHTFTKNSVTVLVECIVAPDGTTKLVGTFTPAEPTLHLYGMDLPPRGIDGVGRPTRLDVVSGTAVAAGPLQANVAATMHQFKNFDLPFPIYPDGPVVLTRPITVTRTTPANVELELSVSFMACSSAGRCKPPVTDHRISVTLPPEW